jgi:hypothetical protein
VSDVYTCKLCSNIFKKARTRNRKKVRTRFVGMCRSREIKGAQSLQPSADDQQPASETLVIASLTLVFVHSNAVIDNEKYFK